MKYHYVASICKVVSSGYIQMIIIIVLLWPVLLSYLLYPATFGFAWNVGRGGFLVVALLTLIEIIESRPVIRSREAWILALFVSLTSLYFVSLYLGSSDMLTGMGRSAGVLIDESWTLMWDYIVLAIYFTVVLLLIFGKKQWIRIGGAVILFLAGYATILLLDSLFPYDSLGFLQSIVPTYLSFNKEILDSIIQTLNVQTDFAPQTLGNALAIYGPDGPFVMKVYWPSAGIHSIIIFGIVMFALFLKTIIPWKRALLYLFSGIILTCIVNGMRITILSLYALDPNSNPSDWEHLHSTVGEIMFIPCILLYVAFVIRLEKRHSGIKRKDGFPRH